MAELTAQERAALARIELMDDPARLRTLIANARAQGSAVVEAAAFDRLCFVQPEATPGTVEHEVWQAIHALEEMLGEERGKTVRLTRTRQKIARDGEAKTVSDLARSAAPAKGFDLLRERDRLDLSFEAVILRHPKTFDGPETSAARDRLEEAGFDIQALIHSSRGDPHG